MKKKYSMKELMDAYNNSKAQAQKNLQKKGIFISAKAPISDDQLKAKIKALKNTYKENGHNPPSEKKLAEELGRRQYYLSNTRQTEAWRKAYEETGNLDKFNYWSFRSKSVFEGGVDEDVLEAIHERRKQLKKEGKTGKDIALDISHTYFGSP